MDFIHRTAEGQNLSAQDKRGALAISSSLPEGGYVDFIIFNGKRLSMNLFVVQ
jgi:hypothetical protein